MPPDDRLTERTLRAVVTAQTTTQEALRAKALLDEERHNEVMAELAHIKGFMVDPEDPQRPKWRFRIGKTRFEIDPDHVLAARPWLVKGLLWALSMLGVKQLLELSGGGP